MRKQPLLKEMGHMSVEVQPTDEQIRKVRKQGRLLWLLSFATLMIGIGGFGTASAGEVEMFGVSIEAKYACFIYFLLGAACLWSTLEARKRGFK
jgi:hypothetical protein